MSDQLPASEENQLDDMLLRSIEILLDENDQSVAMPITSPYPKPILAASNARVQELHQPPSVVPAIQQMSPTAFSIGNQTYRKWSNTESMEQQKPMAPRPARLNFAKPKEPHVKYFKKPMTPTPTSTTPTIPNPMTPMLSPSNAQFMRNQALLAEQANHILNQYMQLNYEFLSAQATVLGIPLEQYIRNLLIATTSPPIVVPTMLPGQAGPTFGQHNLPTAAFQNAHATATRPTANRMPFNKRQN